MKSHHPIWTVAASIMLIEGGVWHYKSLAKKIQETGLADLGGEDPTQTLGSILREHPSKTFEHSTEPGEYDLRDYKAAIAQPEVRSAIRALIPQYLDEYKECIEDTLRLRLLGISPAKKEVSRVNEIHEYLERILDDSLEYQVSRASIEQTRG